MNFQRNNLPDGKNVLDDGEIVYLKNGYFHRRGGPARYLTDGRCLHYINGTDITREVETLYSDGVLVWIDEAAYKTDTNLDLLDETSMFSFDVAFSMVPFGLKAVEHWNIELAARETQYAEEYYSWMQQKMNEGYSWLEVNAMLAN